MSTERLTMLITVLTIATQSGLYLVTGGFSIGSKVSDMGAEIKLIRSEVVSQNEIQNYRLDKLEASLNPIDK
ncbi:hypothetical protein [Trichormus variabilis]|uniref:Uncharacterized protein n=1 Tax=Trichormus variabilis SAG 1403-4b TaxID=447716 RepID=A0A433UIW9_ANAVA|nr:hypothetical protein [Trichormus variabilis]MBD2628848.1 hypothetical protein [Trichormus variabilis FACHB-164]RUS93767.1 hypothetical protein DSM107003_42680 [Trichormus variabilis SAG 1403-4b]